MTKSTRPGPLESAADLTRKLARERDMLSVVMENTPEACLVYLDRDFRFVMVNQTYADGCGMTKEELTGRHHFDLFPNAENEAIFERVKDTGEPIVFKAKPFVFENQPWRGVTYWDWTLTPVKDTTGSVEGLVFSLVDVTDRIRAKQLSDALTQLDRSIHSTLNPHEVMARVICGAREAVGAESAGIVLADGEDWIIAYTCGIDDNVAAVNQRLGRDEAPVATRAASNRLPVSLNENDDDEPAMHFMVERYGVRSILNVPLIVRDAVIGVLGFHYHSEALSFSELQTDFATKLAASVALSLENARLYEERSRAAQLNDALNQISSTMTSSFDEEEIMRCVTTEGRKAVGSDSSRLALDQDGGWLVKFVDGETKQSAGTLIPHGQAPHLRLAAESGAPVVIEDALEDPRVDAALMKKHRLRSLLVVPLTVRGATLATLSFVYHSAPVGFSEAEIDFARKLGVSASLAIESARLYAREHRIAETLQRSLTRPLPNIPGLEIGVAFTSAFEAALVGGDFFDIFTADSEAVVVLVGDVSGKGIEAAGLTETIRSSVRALAYLDCSPAFVFSRLNQSLLRQLPEDVFVTGHLLALDRSTGDVRIATAGHPLPVLVGETSRFITASSGFPLGTVAHVYRETYFKLAGDQSLLLYTDGITEARSARGFFGDKRLLKAVSTARGLRPQDLVNAVLSSATAFARGRLADDAVLLALRLTEMP
jgi:PAS domain S-box-containing protein